MQPRATTAVTREEAETILLALKLLDLTDRDADVVQLLIGRFQRMRDELGTMGAHRRDGSFLLVNG